MAAKVLSAERWGMLERWAGGLQQHTVPAFSDMRSITLHVHVETEGVIFLPGDYAAPDAHSHDTRK